MTPGTLFIVATPIGNLGDISARAITTLKEADLILCEDTRVTKKLLEHFGILNATESYHHHSDVKKTNHIIEQLLNGKNLALVSDAGTPGISDPGNLLVKEATAKNISVIPIPGACAAIAALSISGFPTDKFLFLGFPPHKNKRQKFFKEAAASPVTVVFYESGHRIKKCLQELSEILSPNHNLLVGRELTKKFETVYRGTIETIKSEVMDERGEFVIIVSR